MAQELDKKLINTFVQTFYGHIRKHPVLGPIFEERLANHWGEHMEALTNFWMTVLGGIPSYKGNPMQVHQQVPGIEASHFPLWLDLFAQTAREELPTPIAETAIEKSQRIAKSLQLGLFFKPEL